MFKRMRGGEGQRLFEQCSKKLHFSLVMASLMRSGKRRKKKKEREKNLLNALWLVGLTKGGQFEVWHLERFHIVINFYSTRSQKGSSLQEKVLSVCLFVCPSSLFPSPNIFLFFLLRSSSPPLTNFEEWHLERFHMINDFY